VQSILLAADGQERLTAGRELVLPSPTLVGLPVDEAAYAALFRGYAGHLVSAALVHLLDYTCCETALFQEALLDWQLSRLSLRSAPLADQDYLYLVDAPLGVQHLVELSRPGELLAPDEEAPLEVHAFVDFLRDRLSMRRDPLTDMQRSLSQSGSFWNWVSFLTTYEAADPQALQADFIAFVWDKAREAQQMAQLPPAESQPKQDVLAVCGGETMNVYRYSPLDGDWHKLLEPGFREALLAPFADGDGYIVTGQLPSPDLAGPVATYIQRGEGPPVELPVPNGYDYIVPLSVYEPETGRIVVWTFNEDGESGGSPGVGLLDPAACVDGDCSLQSLPGMPVWSPDGKLALALDVSNGQLLYLPRGRSEWQRIDASAQSWPSWVDPVTFVYVAQRPNGGSENVTVVDTTDGESHTLLRSDDLGNAIARYEGRFYGRFYDIVWAGLHPFRENTILLLATVNTNVTRTFLVELTLDPGQAFTSGDDPHVRLLAAFDGSARGSIYGVPFIASQPYLTFPIIPQSGGLESGGPGSLIYNLHDERVVLTSYAGSSDPFPFSGAHWSVDGQWFARGIPQALELLAPALQRDGQPYRQLAFHDFARCTSVAWLNRP
jgi:hypothetical protein